jgi:hypothetical protein
MSKAFVSKSQEMVMKTKTEEDIGQISIVAI